MQSIAQANTFFFVSSIGFTILFIIVLIAGIYLVKILHTVARISKRVEKDIDTIGDTAKDFVLDLQQSSLFGFLFRKRKKYTK